MPDPSDPSGPAPMAIDPALMPPAASIPIPDVIQDPDSLPSSSTLPSTSSPTKTKPQPQSSPSKSSPTKSSRPKKDRASKANSKDKATDDTPKEPDRPPPIAVSEAHAARTMRYFLASQLSLAGFGGASGDDVLGELERGVLHFVVQMYTLARDYAELANRPNPNARDLLIACEDRGLDVESLRAVARRKRRIRDKPQSVTLLPTSAPPPTPSFLPSDSSDSDTPNNNTKSKSKSDKPSKKAKKNAKLDAAANKDKSSKDKTNAIGSKLPSTLKDLPPAFPALPPKHTYLRTEPPPPPTRTLASLELKFQNSLLVQESLRSLVQATEEALPEPVLLANGTTPLVADGKVPPTLEELGRGGLINFEMVERVEVGLKRPRRWRV